LSLVDVTDEPGAAVGPREARGAPALGLLAPLTVRAVAIAEARNAPPEVRVAALRFARLAVPVARALDAGSSSHVADPFSAVGVDCTTQGTRAGWASAREAALAVIRRQALDAAARDGIAPPAARSGTVRIHRAGNADVACGVADRRGRRAARRAGGWHGPLAPGCRYRRIRLPACGSSGGCRVRAEAGTSRACVTRGRRGTESDGFDVTTARERDAGAHHQECRWKPRGAG